MKFPILMAGAAAIALTAGAASAAPSSTSGKFAAPQQPVAYSKLDAYLKATPRQRAQGDWSNGQTAAAAQTGTPANASATAPQTDTAAPGATQNDMSAPAAPATQAAPSTATPDTGAGSTGAPDSTPPAATPQGSAAPN
jgi:hypothetical protein